MGVSILDGTVEEAVLKRSVRNVRIFHHVRFRLADGRTETIVKPIVEANVARLLQPGASGRFYTFTALDLRGIHGVRDDEGHAVFGFARNNETAMIVALLFALAWVAITIVTVQDAPIIGTLLLLLGTPYYFHLRSLRGQARRQFEADSQYRTPPRLSAEPALGT